MINPQEDTKVCPKEQMGEAKEYKRARKVEGWCCVESPAHTSNSRCGSGRIGTPEPAPVPCSAVTADPGLVPLIQTRASTS
jgi:hypothetical protein